MSGQHEISDCGPVQCEECDVCRYLDFLSWVSHVGKPDGSTIQRDERIEAYLKATYPEMRL